MGGGIFAVFLQITTEVGSYVNFYQLVSDYIGRQILKGFVTADCGNRIGEGNGYNRNTCYD